MPNRRTSGTTTHAALFADRFDVQRRQEGFALVEAWNGDELAGSPLFDVLVKPLANP